MTDIEAIKQRLTNCGVFVKDADNLSKIEERALELQQDAVTLLAEVKRLRGLLDEALEVTRPFAEAVEDADHDDAPDNAETRESPIAMAVNFGTFAALKPSSKNSKPRSQHHDLPDRPHTRWRPG